MLASFFGETSMIMGAIYRGRRRTVEDVVESCTFREAEKAAEIDILVREWLGAESVLIEWQQLCWDALRAGELENIIEAGERLDHAYSSRAPILERVIEFVEWSERSGYVVENAEKFRKMTATIARQRDEHLRKWPRPNKDEFDAAITSLDRGEGVDAGEWLRKLQS
jgi:hypothetical protein